MICVSLALKINEQSQEISRSSLSLYLNPNNCIILYKQDLHTFHTMHHNTHCAILLFNHTVPASFLILFAFFFSYFTLSLLRLVKFISFFHLISTFFLIIIGSLYANGVISCIFLRKYIIIKITVWV